MLHEKSKLTTSVTETKSQMESRITEGRVQRKLVENRKNGPRTGDRDEWFSSYYDPYKKWHSYNRKLLQKLFTGKNEYRYYYPYFVVPTSSSYGDTPVEYLKMRQLSKGMNDELVYLESLLDELGLYDEGNDHLDDTSDKPIDTSSVFIVHGHDGEAKEQVARFITNLGIEPIILHEQVNSGNTIIEKIEEYSNVGYAVALYTACDIGAPVSDRTSLRSRARQNVIFEHGYLIGKLGRKNVCALVKGEIEKPNDISGIVYIPLEDGQWKIDLAKELKNVVYNIDMNLIA